MAVDSKRVKAIFTEAAEIPDRAARRQLLDRECGVDAELRRRIEVLLDAFDAPKPELEQPLARVLADLIPTTMCNRHFKDAAAKSVATDRPSSAFAATNSIVRHK